MCAKPIEERLAVFKNMAEADPENELAQFSLGKVYFEMEDYAAAVATFRRTLELSPRHALAHRFLGETLLQLGEKDEGVELLRTGMLLAHEKGEWQPRNQMEALLKEAGVEPPPLPQATPPPPPQATAATEATEATSTSTQCRRCGQVGPRLDEAPFTTELGAEIQQHICGTCWREWLAVSIKVINEYRLNLMLPEAQETYDNHMREFLGL